MLGEDIERIAQVLEDFQKHPEKQEVSRWVHGEGPRPKMSERKLFPIILELTAGDCPRSIIWLLEDASMTQEEISRFKKYVLRKGLREGWLEDEYFA